MNRLKATLKLCFPAALGWFEDWTAPTAWDFVIAFPAPQTLASCSKNRLCRFLVAHNIGLSPKWKERVKNTPSAATLRADDVTVRAMALRAITTAKRLKSLKSVIDQYARRIRECFESHPDAMVFASLPGAGPKLAPRLLAIFGENRERFESARGIQEPMGTAPITRQSGQKKSVCFRWACSPGLRNTLHLFAWVSIRQKFLGKDVL